MLKIVKYILKINYQNKNRSKSYISIENKI